MKKFEKIILFCLITIITCSVSATSLPGTASPSAASEVGGKVFFVNQDACDESIRRGNEIPGGCGILALKDEAIVSQSSGALIAGGRFVLTNAHVVRELQKSMREGSINHCIVMRNISLEEYLRLAVSRNPADVLRKSKYQGYADDIASAVVYDSYDSPDPLVKRANDLGLFSVRWSSRDIETTRLVDVSAPAVEGSSGFVLPYSAPAVWGDFHSINNYMPLLTKVVFSKMYLNLAFITVEKEPKKGRAFNDVATYTDDKILFSSDSARRLCAHHTRGSSGSPFIAKIDGAYQIAGIYAGKTKTIDGAEFMNVVMFTNDQLAWINRIASEMVSRK